MKRIAALVGVCVVGGVIWLAVHSVREWEIARLVDGNVQNIAAMIPSDSDVHRHLDAVRIFVNEHSRHKTDEAFLANLGDQLHYTEGIIAHAKDPSLDPVHMECSTRTNLMARILQAKGYETRVVAIFTTKRNLVSHSFLEILNPETGKWETQDADYDIYWRNKTSGARISLADEAEHIDAIEPCGRENCGWDHVSREGIKARKLREFLDIITITDKRYSTRYALYTSRADVDRIYSKKGKKGTFCEVESKRCQLGLYDIRNYSSYAAGQPAERSRLAPDPAVLPQDYFGPEVRRNLRSNTRSAE